MLNLHLTFKSYYVIVVYGGMVKVIFVGDRPSKLNKDPDVPFVGARCHSRLLDWVSYLDPKEFIFRNSHTEEELNNIQSLKSVGWKVVALGFLAHKRLERLEINHFHLDHPSGLNRRLNDKVYVNKILSECYNWIRTE